ncbi:hypothetical protein LY76DRAFT_114786 [Colletotrichum caudatum]|nr:hypothetical protein LY76DRAFT_114786 [Colletotrichum caudatum]
MSARAGFCVPVKRRLHRCAVKESAAAVVHESRQGRLSRRSGWMRMRGTGPGTRTDLTARRDEKGYVTRRFPPSVKHSLYQVHVRTYVHTYIGHPDQDRRHRRLEPVSALIVCHDVVVCTLYIVYG